MEKEGAINQQIIDTLIRRILEVEKEKLHLDSPQGLPQEIKRIVSEEIKDGTLP